MQFTENTTFSYSKHQNLNPARPIVVDSRPCLDPYVQVNKVSYGTELQTNKFCTPVLAKSGPQWNMDYMPVSVGGQLRNNLSDDYQSAWYTNEWQVQEENLVNKLLKVQPSFAEVYENTTAEQGAILQPWSRPIIAWSLACETEGFTR